MSAVQFFSATFSFSAGAEVANVVVNKSMMQLQNNSGLSEYLSEEETQPKNDSESSEPSEVETEDTDPPLDEEDLEENGLTVEEADQIIWDAPKEGSAGAEEKDITD